METHHQTCHRANNRFVRTWRARLLILPIRAYQYLISPWVGHHCRFQPTCSHYAIEAIDEHGAGRGLLLALRRLLKCHPWHRGGYDPVPTHSITKHKMVNK